MAEHYFGMRVDGALGRFDQHFGDDEFEQLTRCGLPQGWVAWHFDRNEARSQHGPGSMRLEAFAKLPIITETDLFSHGLIAADPRRMLRKFMEEKEAAVTA